MKHNKIITIFIIFLICISILIHLIYKSDKSVKIKGSKAMKGLQIPSPQQIISLAILLIPISRIFLND